jgi:DnaJ-class molecular chaperone
MSVNDDPRPPWWPDSFPWPFVPSTDVEFVDEYDHENDCPRCQGSGEVPTADYESYFGQNYKPCPMCGGNGDR